MAQPPDRMRWDTLPVADTRIAMKGGVPFLMVMPIFMTPGALVVLTFKVWLLALIPVLWFLTTLCFSGNQNRPFEWLLWLSSGAAFASWRPWGGISVDPHGSPSDKDVFL